MSSAKYKIEVVEMQQSCFRDYRSHLRHYYTERTKDIDKKPIHFSSAVWFNFGRGEKFIDGQLTVVDHPNGVWVRHTYDSKEIPQRVKYNKKRAKGQTHLAPPCLYQSFPISIKKAKADDVKKLVSHYVPARYQGFYSYLPALGDSDSDND